MTQASEDCDMMTREEIKIAMAKVASIEGQFEALEPLVQKHLLDLQEQRLQAIEEAGIALVRQDIR